MGLFDNFKKSDEQIRDETLTKYNIFDGIECEVIFPDTQLKIGTRSGVAKGAATLAFGLVGLAATSGITQKEEKRKIKTVLQVVEKGIVFKRATKDEKDLRIPYENIVKVNHKTLFGFEIVLLENQVIKLELSDIRLRLNQVNILSKHIMDTLNERACGSQYEEAGWGP